MRDNVVLPTLRINYSSPRARTGFHCSRLLREGTEEFESKNLQPLQLGFHFQSQLLPADLQLPDGLHHGLHGRLPSHRLYGVCVLTINLLIPLFVYLTLSKEAEAGGLKCSMDCPSKGSTLPLQ